MKNTVIFDLDGTLLNTLDDLADSMNKVLQWHNYPLHTRDEICSYVGNGIRKLVERAVPEGTEPEKIQMIFEEFKVYYGAHCLDKTLPYIGIKDMLDAFRALGYKLAIVSNKADEPVKVLANHFFGSVIATAIGERPGVRKKPYPDTVFQAMLELGSTGEETVYVGDSEVDIQTAAHAGIDVVSVTWGFRRKEFLKAEGAVQFADTPEELIGIISAM